MSEMRIAPAPLFKCPIGDCVANPRVIWNRQEKSWFLFYTQRNKNSILQVGDQVLSFSFGTDIAIASSRDNGRSWIYRGVPEGLSIEPGKNTFGMAEVIWHDGLFHMYCEYMQGFPTPVDFSDPGQLAHYTSEDLWHWTFQSFFLVNDHKKTSMCVYQLPTGKWRMYYTDNTTGELPMLESNDLYKWKPIGNNVDCKHNSTNIFRLGGYYWMTIDTYEGYAVFRSDDCENWTRQDGLLFNETSARMDDGSRPHHSGVVELKDQVYLFYYTHPERIPGLSAEFDPGLPDRIHGEPHLRRAVIQVAEVMVNDGRLVGNRNEPFDFYLPNMT